MIDSKKLANMLLFNDISKMSAHQPANVVNIAEKSKPVPVLEKVRPIQFIACDMNIKSYICIVNGIKL